MTDSSTGFTPISTGDADEDLRNEVLAVYIWYIVKNFLEEYNLRKPDMSPSEWLCLEDTVLDLLPRSGDEFAVQLAGIMELNLTTAPLERMRQLATEVVRHIVGELQAVFLIPEGTALVFERPMAA